MPFPLFGGVGISFFFMHDVIEGHKNLFGDAERVSERFGEVWRSSEQIHENVSRPRDSMSHVNIFTATSKDVLNIGK